MRFTRFEIRWHYRRCFYEGGDSMEYIPFDTLEQAEKYAQNHQASCASDCECECGIYKVDLYSTYDNAKLIKKL